MADCSCDYCQYEGKCKQAYKELDCVYDKIVANPSFDKDTILSLLKKSLECLNDMDVEDYKQILEWLIRDIEYDFSDELKKEYKELIEHFK